MLRYDDLQVFVHTSDSGSLSAAARQLEISPAVASAALKRLESELEVRLFARSTRSLRLTPEGDAFLLHARASLRSLEEGRRLLQGGKDQIAGVLQLSAPSDFGRNLLLPWLSAFRAAHPDHIALTYINCSAAVKALTDICCTSSNAVEVVASIPEDREVLFCPDQFLGAHVRRVTGRKNLHVWAGECHVHAGINGDELAAKSKAHPDAELFVHPECGCATSALYLAGEGAVLERVVQDDDVAAGLSEKMVRRHPHVFGDAQADDAGQVVANWEQIKQRERADAGALLILLHEAEREDEVRAHRGDGRRSGIGDAEDRL